MEPAMDDQIPTATPTVQQILDPTCTTSAREPSQSQPTTLPLWARQFGFLPNLDDWLPGDLVLFSKLHPNWIERQISGTQKKLQYSTGDARWHHAAVYIGDRYLCEARRGGVRYCPVVECIDTNTLLRVRRDPALAEPQRFRMAIRALMRLSQPYSYGSIGRTLLRSLNPQSLVLALRPQERAVICSQLFHEAYMEATDSTLVENADRAVVPAELSATNRLQDVTTHWVRLNQATP